MVGDTPNPTLPEPRRFSIRLPRPLWIGSAAVVLVVVAVGLHLGLPIYRQHAAIREIERLKGIITTEKNGPDWLRKWLGDDRMRILDDVTEINLAMSDVSDDGLRDVAMFTNLSKLNLARTKVTDAGVDRLKGLRKLKRLVLSDTQVTDLGIGKLNGLENLRNLDLRRTKISDTGLANLKGLTHLVMLDLSGTNVTEAGIQDAKEALPRLNIETGSRLLLRSRTGGGLF